MSNKFISRVPWEDLYVYDLVIIAESLKERVRGAIDMERSHGGEGVEGKCRKNKGHDLWYRPGPLAEFKGPLRCLL